MQKDRPFSTTSMQTPLTDLNKLTSKRNEVILFMMRNIEGFIITKFEKHKHFNMGV